MIHIFILNWNGAEKLSKLKDGLYENLAIANQDYIIHIRDNGSSDNSIEIIKDWPNARIYDIGHNRDNFAQGMNYLFDRATPTDEDLILLLNNDIQFVSNDSLMNMTQCMRDGVGAVGCRLLYTNTNKLQHAGTIFSEKYGRMPYHYRAGEESDANAEKNRYFQAVTAACCLIRASSFRRVGGMDSDYRWAFEDVTLLLGISITLKEKVVYCGKTKIYHEESASLKKNPLNKMFMQHNVRIFKKKWWEEYATDIISDNIGTLIKTMFVNPKYEIDHEKYLNDPNYNVIKE